MKLPLSVSLICYEDKKKKNCVHVTLAVTVFEYQIKNKPKSKPIKFSMSFSYPQPVTSHCDCPTECSGAHAVPISPCVTSLILRNHKSYRSSDLALASKNKALVERKRVAPC